MLIEPAKKSFFEIAGIKMDLEMAKMRDVLIHQYDGIDLEIVWETIKVDLVEVEKYVKDIYSKI